MLVEGGMNEKELEFFMLQHLKVSSFKLASNKAIKQ